MRKIIFFFTLLALLGLAACTGEGISGSISGSSVNMYANDAGGTVDASYNEIKGTYPETFEASIYNDDFVNVTLTASVETGRLRVYLKQPDDTTVELSLSPGESGSLSGLAEVWADETFRVYLDAVDGIAEGVTLQLEFSYEAP